MKSCANSIDLFFEYSTIDTRKPSEGGASMAKAKKTKQISFSKKDKPGLLTEVTTLLADSRVNINAICAYAMNRKAYFMMITDRNAKAIKALTKLRIKPRQDDVISVEMPNTVGALQNAAQHISSAGINILYMYGTATSGKKSTCVLSTTDDRKAVRALNKK
jgi:hypothetical protein